MKEKIWIEKLIELFKEYVDNHWTDTKDIEKEYWVIDDWQAFLYWQRTYLYEILISKKFGMVKWLVENDKIDFRKADADISKDIVLWREPDFMDFMIFRRFADYEKVLMLLSISSSSIDDLINYLK